MSEATVLAAESQPYKIHLPQFEGPFDLLLFFIERDELDIHDIPIARITHDFLDYIHTLETMNIEVAAEFILVAATLMKIKAKMLLPRPVVLEDGTVEDPRTELVNRLLEYKRYKEVLGEIESMEVAGLARLKRGFVKKEEKLLLQSEFPEEEMIGIDLYTIFKTFRRVWLKHQAYLEKPRHVVRKYPYSIDQVKDTICDKLASTKKIDFVSFIMEIPDKIYVVFSFLAVLELAQSKRIKLVIGEGFNNFWMTPNPEAEPA